MASVPSSPAVGTTRNPQAFGKRGVIGLVVFGTLAFLAFIYLIGAGQMSGPANNGQSHAGSRGLTGYAGLVELLRLEGHDVSLSRSEAAYDDPGLLVLTPPHFGDPEEFAAILDNRRYTGPTLVILPKWQVSRATSEAEDAKTGWVRIVGPMEPLWTPMVDEIEMPVTMQTSDDPIVRRWSMHDGRSGTLPESISIQGFDEAGSKELIPLVRSGDRLLAGYFEDNGLYYDLAAAAGIDTSQIDEDDFDGELWNVTFVAEPDLMNNWGLSNEVNARLAHDLIDYASEGDDQPIVFDLTLNGLGSSRNLLTLAFEPPFLAATLCLIMALLLVGWRAFRRFGPAVAPEKALAFGKAQLVENGAGVIQRTRRMHLLTRPYAALVEKRLARKLGLRQASRDAIDDALGKRGLEPASPRLAALENAHHRADIIRAARALTSLERTVTR